MLLSEDRALCGRTRVALLFGEKADRAQWPGGVNTIVVHGTSVRAGFHQRIV